MTNYVRASVAVLASTVAMLVCNGDDSHGAKITDGNSLLRMCETALKPSETCTRIELMDQMYLFGYVNGFIAAGPQGVAYDLPRNITGAQGVRIIKKWLEDHPNMLNEPAAPLIVHSLREAFPPQKPQSR
jgi:Rap1a immunity proteins